MKPSLSWRAQAELLARRGLEITDLGEVECFLRIAGYYRLSGYGRYFQVAPHLGDDRFVPGTTFDEIRELHDRDTSLRHHLSASLAQAEIALRAHTAHVIAQNHSPYRSYLRDDFYSGAPNHESVAESVRRDIARSKERHILRYGTRCTDPESSQLPVWSAVESWSFGTLSKTIERGAEGTLTDSVATSLGVAKAGFAFRVRSLVYLRNRCAHHGRLWNHSVLDAGPTPNNVRAKAKRSAGQFEPRSVVDIIASLDDILTRSGAGLPILPALIADHAGDPAYWKGLSRPQSPRDGAAPADLPHP